MSYLYKAVPDGTYCLTNYNGHEKHIELPHHLKVSILGDKLYKGHTEIESIELPETITQIGGFVFDGCENLKKLQLPPHLKDMWQYALTRMSIETIEIPASLSAIIPFTFNECKQLKTVTFKGPIRLDAWAFKNCESLADVYFKDADVTIHPKAFEGCPNVKIHKGA